MPIYDRGQELLVNASGALSSTIDKGSFVHIQVKLAGTRIVNKKYDLCAGLKRFGQSCPFNAGYISVSKGFKIDKMIPRVCRPGIDITFASHRVPR